MLKHFAVAALFCAASAVLVEPASADNRVPVKLQPAVPYMAPLQVQILDESPRVHDLRQQAQETNYIISVPALQNAPTKTVVIGAPGSAASGSQNIVLNPNHPPPAGFITNIPGHSLVPAGNLPSGKSTSLLAGHMNPSARPVPAVAPHMISPTPPHQNLPVVQEYAPLLPSASASGSGYSKIDVKAVMKPQKIGNLLQR